MAESVTFLDGRVTLFLGDCRDVLPMLPAVDAVITSPPYNLGNVTLGGERLGHYRSGDMSARGGHGKWKRADDSDGIAHGYGSHNDAMPHAEYVAWQREIVRGCWDRLTDKGAIFYNHKPRILDGVLVTPLAYLPDLPVRQVVIWARSGGVNYSTVYYCPTHEWITVLAKPDFRLRDKAASGVGDVWRIHQESNTEHPAPFPLALPMQILQTTAVETVLDPFMGSGTTGVAAARLGRRFIGIELEPRFFEAACRRIEAATHQADMFHETAAMAQPSMFPNTWCR